MDIKELFEKDYIGKKITVQGWVRNHRKQAHYGFIDLSDGTCFEHLQVVYDDTLDNFEIFEEFSLFFCGTAAEDPGTRFPARTGGPIKENARVRGNSLAKRRQSEYNEV